MRNLSSGFPTRSDTNQAVQTQKMARGLKFRIKKVKGFHNLCRENKGANCCAVTAHLICAFVFTYMQKAGFFMMRLIC